MRILHVSPTFGDAWAYGGIPRAVTALARAQAAAGHQVVVASTDAGGWDSRQPAPRPAVNLEVHLFRNLSNRAAHDLQFFAPQGLRDFLHARSSTVDVAHLHACHNLPGVWASEALGKAGTPYIVSPHGTGPRTERRFLSKWAFDVTVGRRVLPDARRVVAASGAERRDLLDLGIEPARLRQVPNPIELSELDPPPRRGRFRRSLGHEGELVVFLGRLGRGKCLEVLVRAFARLGRPAAVLALIGNDAGVESELRNLSRDLGLASAVRFVGMLAGRDRLEALADADVVAYAGAREVFGLVPVEALLCGTRVVVADDSGCGELISRIGGGEVVAQGDVQSLSSALAEALDHPQSANVESAAERIRAELAPGVVASQMDAVYREATAQ